MAEEAPPKPTIESTVKDLKSGNVSSDSDEMLALVNLVALQTKGNYGLLENCSKTPCQILAETFENTIYLHSSALASEYLRVRVELASQIAGDDLTNFYGLLCTSNIPIRARAMMIAVSRCNQHNDLNYIFGVLVERLQKTAEKYVRSICTDKPFVFEEVAKKPLYWYTNSGSVTTNDSGLGYFSDLSQWSTSSGTSLTMNVPKIPNGK